MSIYITEIKVADEGVIYTLHGHENEAVVALTLPQAQAEAFKVMLEAVWEEGQQNPADVLDILVSTYQPEDNE